MRILLIDDDTTVTDNLKLFFESSFHTVESLAWVGGQEMLSEFLEEFRPQGVILDYGMIPTGTQIYRWIRGHGLGVPIAFYTSYAQRPEYREEMRGVGARMDQIVEKSEVGLDVSSLLRALEA